MPPGKLNTVYDNSAREDMSSFNLFDYIIF